MRKEEGKEKERDKEMKVGMRVIARDWEWKNYRKREREKRLIEGIG